MIGAVLFVVAASAAAGLWMFLRPAEVDVPAPNLNGTPPAVEREFAVLREEVRGNSRAPAPWGRLGMFLMAHHYAAEAGACLRRAAELDPDEFRWRYYQAVLLEETDLCLSADAYASALRLEGSYLPMRLRYAAILLRLNRPEEAREQYAEVIQRAPQEHYAYLALARLAVAAGELERARPLFEKAIECAPWSRDAHAELARAAILANDSGTALREHQLAARLLAVSYRWPDPLLGEVEQFEAVSRQLAGQADQLMLRGDSAAAVAAYRKLIEARPELSRPWLNLGQTLYAQGRIAEAVAAYRELVKRFPDIAEGYYSLGLALEGGGDLEGALASYRACVERKPDYAEAHFAIGLVLEKRGDDDGAAQAYRRAVEVGPQFAPAHLALAVVLERRHELADAIHHAECAVRLAPSDPVPRQYLDRFLKQREPD